MQKIIIKDYVTKWHNYGMYRAFAKIDLKKLFGRFYEHSRIKIIRYDRSSLKSRKASSLFDIFLLLKLSEISLIKEKQLCFIFETLKSFNIDSLWLRRILSIGLTKRVLKHFQNLTISWEINFYVKNTY
jgi:hypothetical protein